MQLPAQLALVSVVLCLAGAAAAQACGDTQLRCFTFGPPPGGEVGNGSPCAGC